MKAKSKDVLDKNEDKLLPPSEVLEEQELNKREELEKVKNQEDQELAKLEKANKQEELKNYQQQPDESELQKKLVSLFSMVSLELNMEGPPRR